MGAPRIDQVNLVVPDAASAARFLADLGVELPEVDAAWEEWAPHHRQVPAAEPCSSDLDSSAVAAWWGGLPPGFAGVVVTVRVDTREEVDRLHAEALGLGATPLKDPHDAFWGARCAVVQAPGPVAVGIMSPTDDARRSAGPEITDFA